MFLDRNEKLGCYLQREKFNQAVDEGKTTNRYLQITNTITHIGTIV